MSEAPDALRPVILFALDQDTEEMAALVDAAGLRLLEVVYQRRDRADAATYLGRGKVREVRERLDDPHPLFSGGRPLVIVADDVKPSVVFNLEAELRVEVWDRVRLILEIFERNAQVREARLQVELARLRYNLPFVHEAIHRQMTGERPGYMGGGEMEFRTYETHLRRRTRQITLELERVKKERALRREGRRRGGLRLLAIAGYTNSGKSSLLNALTGSDVMARQQVFSTLQTSTRRLHSTYHHHRSSDILLTDTVGFIQNLPPWLVDAFGSTLEEITYADAVLFVVDASEAVGRIEEKVATALGILERIHAPRHRVVLLNKADLLTSGRRDLVEERVRARLHPSTRTIFTSTTTGEGLQRAVDHVLEGVLESRTARLALDRGQSEHVRLENWLRDHTDVLDVTDEGARRILEIRCGIPAWGHLLHRAAEAHVPVHPSNGS